jgi:hypothetical protein
MINLAGREWADDTIKLELRESGIPIHKFFGEHKQEVPWTYEGILFGWTFHRAWYYWMANGRLPLHVAKYIYEMDNTKSIRVNGHCAAPAPEDPWLDNFDANGYGLFHTETEPPQESMMHLIWRDIQLRGSYVDKPMSVAPYSYVTSYHIDTQEGLNFFATTLKKYEQLAYAAAVNLK